MAASIAAFQVTDSADTNLSTINCDYPSGIAAGHLLLAAIAWRNSTTGITSGGGVFDLIEFSNSGGDVPIASGAMFERDADGAESGTAGFSRASGAARVVGAIARIVDHGGVEDFAVNTGEGTAVTAPSVTSLGADRLLVVMVAHNHGGTTHTVSDMTEVYNVNSGANASNNVRQSMHRETVGSGATGTRTGTLSASATWVALAVVVAPAAGGGQVTVNLAPATARAAAQSLDPQTTAPVTVNLTAAPMQAVAQALTVALFDPPNLQANADGDTVTLTWDPSPLVPV